LGYLDIETLEGMPQYLAQDLRLDSLQKLVSLKGMPSLIHGELKIFSCDNLENLEDCAKKVHLIDIGINKKLKSLKGCPIIDDNTVVFLMFNPSLDDFADIPQGKSYSFKGTFLDEEFVKYAKDPANNFKVECQQCHRYELYVQ